jgi:hypothetical protein
MKNKNILKWIVPVLCVVGLSSCLKNKNEQPDFSAATPVVEIPVQNPSGSGSTNTLGAYFATTEAPSDYFFYINYAASEANDRDITVTLRVDPTLITGYNTANGGSMKMLPTAAFTMPLSVTIPAGQRRVQVPVKFVTTLLSANFTYGLPVTITDASGVTLSKNFTSVIVTVNVKNVYDGIFSYEGTVIRAGETTGLAGPTISGLTSNLVTVNADTTELELHWANGGGVAGVDHTRIAVNPTTNKVTMFSQQNATLANTPGFDNRWDPATKTFYLSFDWNSGARGMRLTLKYQGPRP